LSELPAVTIPFYRGSVVVIAFEFPRKRQPAKCLDHLVE
jgi:hypothetical protein